MCITPAQGNKSLITPSTTHLWGDVRVRKLRYQYGIMKGKSTLTDWDPLIGEGWDSFTGEGWDSLGDWDPFNGDVWDPFNGEGWGTLTDWEPIFTGWNSE